MQRKMNSGKQYQVENKENKEAKKINWKLYQLWVATASDF